MGWYFSTSLLGNLGKFKRLVTIETLMTYLATENINLNIYSSIKIGIGGHDM